MGGGNAQKSKMARERNLEKQKGGKGSQLEANKKAMSIQSVQGLHVNFHLYNIRSEVQRTRRG